MLEKVRPFFHLIEEFHVDATYKTNRANCELYGVMANVHGAGFPVSYLLLETKHVANDYYS